MSSQTFHAAPRWNNYSRTTGSKLTHNTAGTSPIEESRSETQRGTCSSPRAYLHLMLRELKRRGRLELETTMIDSAQVRAFGGGDRSGPSPVDRRKPGTKYTVLVDARGTPLAMQTAAANVSDHRQILSTVVRYPQIGGTRGRPRNHPAKLYADAGYDSNATRELLLVMGIEPIIRRRSTPHGSHLGKVRWVVERTISWIKGLRRMRIRYDRHPTIIDAWNHLALAAVCFRILCQPD